ncbi:MAG: flavocytochrome c [Enterococcus lacertideformus]|uniref:Flavocytochrome c n=1 Tax=Enterococcus lacertideformus TaxID=2771493 RepID=A0A931F897_9ENTE|nr:flavocytochrome c [Enterococcus lacertideformus]
MRKIVKSLFIFTSVLTMGACSVDTKETTTAKSTNTSEKIELSSGASEQTYTNPAEMKSSYDIIIVGAGGAGMSAAIEAKDAGMNPVIFEKMPVAGGNTLKSSSGMNASETKFQKANGIEDSNDIFYEETLKGGGGTNNQALLRYFVDHSAGAIDWLDQNGIKLDNLTITGGMSEKRTHRPSDGSAIGGYLVNGLLKNVHKRKIPVFVNTKVTEIKKNNGKVNEVTVQVQGEEPKEITGKAIVVTSGGYGASEKFIEKYRPDLEGYVTTNQSGSTGDGISMIEKLGGQVVDMDKIQIHPTVQQDEGVLIGEAVRGEGAILVNQEGERFVNELDTRDKVSAAIPALPDKSAYLIFDQGVRERAKAIDFYEQKGYVISGDNVAELAEKIALPQEALAQTLNTWNEVVASKKDEQYRRTTAMEHDLSTPKYYAIKIAPGIHYTMGGVKVNTNTEVLNKENKVITGLYTAGEVTGGLHGDNRIGGNSVAEIIIFGRQAGQQAAKFVSES